MNANKYGKSYYESFFSRPKPNSQRKRTSLAELLVYQPGGKLFEIGCGRGEFLALAKKHFDVQGMDISPYAVQVALDGLSGRIVQGNIEEENISSGSYDAIIAFNVLEHLHQPARVIEKVFRGLREQGVFMGSVPLNAAVLGRIHTLLTNLFDSTHVSTYAPETWRELFARAGFRLVHFFGELNIGKNRHVYVRSHLWQYLSFNLMFVCRK